MCVKHRKQRRSAGAARNRFCRLPFSGSRAAGQPIAVVVYPRRYQCRQLRVWSTQEYPFTSMIRTYTGTLHQIMRLYLSLITTFSIILIFVIALRSDCPKDILYYKLQYSIFDFFV